MSRHVFDCKVVCEVRVTLGYGESGYFLEVMWTRVEADPNGQPEYLYHWKNDPRRVGDDLNYYRVILKNLDLVAPERMFKEVQKDPDGSNRVVEYFADGQVVQRRS